MTTGSRRAGALYPWYDSRWLSDYVQAKAVLRKVRPDRLADFIEAFRVFHTPAGFAATPVERVFDAAAMERIGATVSLLRPTDLELHEARSFGRFVVHDHAVFSELQRTVVPLVSKIVGEAVEPSYNFLSLYSSHGVCPVHMDSPEAKWTLDVCLAQSAPWPIYFSDVQPWPEDGWSDRPWDGWEETIKRTHRFTPHALTPGRAVVFSGSSQWHYRDAMPGGPGRQFCDLLFFHFVPEGTRELVQPKNWARLFGVPELERVTNGARETPTDPADRPAPRNSSL